MQDINQGGLNDCYLLAALGETTRQAIIQDNLSFITNMIHVNSDGTETVKLYQGTDGNSVSWATTAFKPVYETVTNTFPTYAVNGGSNQDTVGNTKEIWPQVIEKADAQLHGGYGAFANGGNAYLAMEELTGKQATWMAPDMSLSAFVALTNEHDLIVFDTPSSGQLPDGLVNWHSYMYEGMTGSGASTMIHLGNPWGFDQPQPMLFSQLSKGFVGVNVGHPS
jgi:hypothetical protein